MNTVAVQVREGSSTWHATVSGGKVTHCGIKMPIEGWVEHKPARFVINDKWCSHAACTSAFNREMP